jgi:hypothetical protein
MEDRYVRVAREASEAHERAKARGASARRRNSELAERLAELRTSRLHRPPLRFDVETLRALEAKGRADVARQSDAIAHQRSLEAHERSARTHDAAAQLDDLRGNVDGAAGHRREAEDARRKAAVDASGRDAAEAGHAG